jgi:predicted nucleic acid-binding protein
VGVAWAVKGQASFATDELRQSVASSRRVVVPVLWAFEVAQTLIMLVRRGRLEPEDRADAYHWLSWMEPEIDDVGSSLAFGRISDLAEEHSLTVYDATYLELALRRALPLASRDEALNQAARRCGLETLL